MSFYRFVKYGVLVRDDHPLALYAGNRRLSPAPKIVWWFPWNWIVCAALLPVAVFSIVRKWAAAR